MRGKRKVSVNRTELVAAIADKAGLTKVQADAAVSALQDVLVDSLGKGEAVKITGLLSVERVERKARTGRNPRTGEEIQIPAGYGVKISAGSTLKMAVAKYLHSGKLFAEAAVRLGRRFFVPGQGSLTPLSLWSMMFLSALTQGGKCD